MLMKTQQAPKTAQRQIRIRRKTSSKPKDLDKDELMFQQALELVGTMKGRPARENIRCIKKEIKNVDISNGLASNTTSATQINK
jgi:hypothetical protein